MAAGEREGHPVRIGAVTETGQPDDWLTAIANGEGIALAPSPPPATTPAPGIARWPSLSMLVANHRPMWECSATCCRTTYPLGMCTGAHEELDISASSDNGAELFDASAAWRRGRLHKITTCGGFCAPYLAQASIETTGPGLPSDYSSEADRYLTLFFASFLWPRLTGVNGRYLFSPLFRSAPEGQAIPFQVAMAQRVADGPGSLATGHFVRDSELGWGRSSPDSRMIAFFDSPTRPEVVLPSAGRDYRVTLLPPQERAWWFDGDLWMVGRIDSPQTSEGDAYFVHFPNGRTEVVPSREIRIRWSVPLADPLGLLKVGTVETRFFHTLRTNFLHSVTKQRSACLGFGGLLSSAVEIYDHQVGAARRVLSDPVPRYLLADEVGLGKTIEAGMVLRQLLLDSAGIATVIAPDQIVGQWKQELALKFRVHQLPGTTEVVGHSAISRMQPDARTLTIVDEAHLFTDHVNYGGSGYRDQQYDALRAIAHASKALLLLSATPVRSNEDAFLGLLHLLDPVNYPLTDLRAFRRRVEMRDDLAQAMSAVNAETPLRYLDDPLVQVSELLQDDPVAGQLVSNARRCIAAGQENEARAEVNRLRIYVSETYRVHRRMIRNRRSTAVKNGFPARGRELAHPWLIPDPDDRRQDLFAAFDDLRLGLELTDHPAAGPILQVVLGRILAPMAALNDLVRALQRKPDHDLSAAELATISDLGVTVVGREFADDLEQLLAMTTDADRMSAAGDWARRRIGRGKYAVACTFPNTARLTAQLLADELGRHRVTALLEGQSQDERTRLAGEFARSTELSILVIDRSAEEGANLQFIEEVLHLNVPTFSTHLEQRLGRFDRWSELPRPVRSLTFTEADAIGHRHIDAWTMTLNDVFGAFTSSTSTLQYVLSDLEAEFFRTAVTRELCRSAGTDTGAGWDPGDSATANYRARSARQHRGSRRRRRPRAATRQYRRRAAGFREGSLWLFV